MIRLPGAAVFLFCAIPAASQMTAPPAPPSVVSLRDAFVETLEDRKKSEILATLARTPAVTARDLQALYDLFMRFPDAAVRDSALGSLALVDAHSPHLEPLFVRYLQEPEPESVLFGVKGALRIRAPSALPLIQKIAKRKFAFKSPQDAPLVSEKNAWWAQYEALAALAQWRPAQALPLIKDKTRQAPGVARLLGLYLWKESLNQIAAWARSSDPKNREKAQQALSAQVPMDALRQSRPEMLKRLLDSKEDRDLRHQLALNIGLSSTDDDAAALVKEYDAASDPETRLMLAAALFASRSRRAVPLLTSYAKANPNAQTRAGARLQLRDMLTAEEYRPLLEWAARDDPDPDNRREASRELDALKAAK